MTGANLRDRKKQQTRQAIMEVALRLFAERGFERVTVVEIARESNVAEATVFNYFPVKEDLVYSQMETFEQRLVDAVRDREPGQSPLAAFRACLLTAGGLLGSLDAGSVQSMRTLARIIAGSPVLLARELQIYQDATDALSRVIAQQTSAGDHAIEPWVTANALIGVHRALVSHARIQLLAGRSTSTLRRSIRTRADRAFALLEHGLKGPDAMTLETVARSR
jgi:AcrR family transcriptional regulator